MTAACSVKMCKLIHQNQLRLPAERLIQIELTVTVTRCIGAELQHWQLFKPVQQDCRFRTSVRLNESGNDVSAIPLLVMRGIQHGAGFADAFGISEENFQFAAFLDCTL